MYVSRFYLWLSNTPQVDEPEIDVTLFQFLANQDWAAQEQSLRIFNLQLERERLKRRQQEIAKLNVGSRLSSISLL